MSLHFYYYFLYSSTSLILPSYFRCLAMVVYRSSSAQQHANIKGTCLLPPLQLTRAENRKVKDVDFKRTRPFRFSLIRCDSRFLFSSYYSTSTLFHFRLFPECPPPPIFLAYYHGNQMKREKKGDDCVLEIK